MEKLTIDSFALIGIAVRTTNENAQAATDIPALWSRFFEEGALGKIPHKADDAVVCIYTDYEKDHTRPYTTILGCRVSELSDIPEGMVGVDVNGGTYLKFTAAGNLSEGVVYNEWTKIWSADIPRAFTADFEVYGAKAANPEAAEVGIFIAVN